jgi:predicted amidophosphoribosyltransferase
MTLLARRGQSRQVGARRMQRTTQLVDAFHPIRPSLIQGAHILLVDDIVTTGASLEAAARVLKQAGAKRIDAVVFAQKI